MIALVIIGWTLFAFVVGAIAGYRSGYDDAERAAVQRANRISQYLEELDAKGGE